MVELRDLIGVKYTVHGRSKQEGFDCYGLVIEVYKRLGITLQDFFYNKTDRLTNLKTGILIEKTLPVKVEKAEKYCIIGFDNNSHIGVYLGDDEFIHCTELNGVSVAKLSRWKIKVSGYYKVSNQSLF